MLALSPPPAAPSGEFALNALLADCYADPLAFVLTMYPWGQPGTMLEHDPGPDTWQREFLASWGAEITRRKFDGRATVAPIRMAVSSGHGVGKSVMVAWIVDFIMATRPRSKGTITANTSTQLETKTWPTITTWSRLCLAGHRWTINSARMYQTTARSETYVTPQTCREENSEAFAGQHEKNATSFYIFDEDSAVPDMIHSVAEGGLTDGEPMIFLFGNPTRTSGQFHRACFGAERHRWISQSVDSRTSRFTNKETIAEWLALYGEDSDFFRVRVRGLPPRASDAQFIDHDRVMAAQTREVVVLPDEPLVVGCDLAWGGSDDNVIRFRRGRDARSIPPIRIKGEFTRDPSVLTNRLGDVLTKEYDGRKVAMLFLDSAGIAGPIAERLRQAGHRNVAEVNFGADSHDSKCRYMRDYMWERMKQWLLEGAIDRDGQLETDLLGPGLRPDGQQRIWLEDKKSMKSRGLDSPDDADALALTFARAVVAAKPKTSKPVFGLGAGGWMS